MLMPLTEPTLLPTAVSPETARVLRRGVERVKLDPKSFHMDNWRAVRECGTTFCFAGQIILDREPDFDAWDHSVWRSEDDHVLEPFPAVRAAQLAGLTMAEADRLFYISGWPPTFLVQLWGDDMPIALERRVEHFIETGE